MLAHRRSCAPLLAAQLCAAATVLSTAVISTAALTRVTSDDAHTAPPAADLTPAPMHAARSTVESCAALTPSALNSVALAVFEDNVDAPTTSFSDRLSLDISVDWTTAYYFRGIIQENRGVIVQPAVEVGYAVNENVSVFIGTWNSFHDAATGSTDSDRPSSWWVEPSSTDR